MVEDRWYIRIYIYIKYEIKVVNIDRRLTYNLK